MAPMALDHDDLPEVVLEFLRERHLGTLTTQRADGSPHVVPVGFAFDPDARVVRIISADMSQKVVNAARRGARAAVCQVDGGRWLTMEGPVEVRRDPAEVARAERAYGERYQEPRPRDDRVAIVIRVDRVMGRA
jgi:PPOX class probable F420-dependent enzyme